jgi:hypothetical protein
MKQEGNKMTDPVKPQVSRTFKSVCLVEDSPDGKGIKVTAYGNNGVALASGKDFVKKGIIWDDFIDNMNDLITVGGKATGDSYALGRKSGDATFREGGIALNVSKGICDVSTVDRGGVPEGTMRMGVVLKNPSFDVTR